MLDILNSAVSYSCLREQKIARRQKGRDLNWYAKASDNVDDGEDPSEKAARERREETRRVKEN